MNNRNNEVDEISFQKLIEIPLQHKTLIIIFIILSTIVAYAYIYFHPNIYQATTTLEISVKKNASGVKDLLTSALSQESTNIDTEMEIIKSRFVAQKALEHVDFINHYYGVENYKKIELYKDTPLKVELKKGYGVEFNIYPLTKNTFKLEVKNLKNSKNQSNHSYYKELHYGEWIKNKYFEIKVNKINKLNYTHYIYKAYKINKIVDKLRKKLNVKPATPKASIVVISFEDNVAKRAKEYVNAIAKAYLEQSIARKTKEASLKLSFIDKQLKEISKNLKVSENKLSRYKEKTNTIDLSKKANILVEKVTKLETELQKVSLKRKVIELLYKQVKSGYGIENISFVGIGNDGNSIIYMVQQLQNAIIKKRMLLQEYTNAHPEVIKVTSSIIQLKHSIFKNIKAMLKIVKEREAFLTKEIAKENSVIETLPENEKVLTNLKRKFLLNEKLYSYLLEQRSESSIVKASTISSNRVIDKATIPDKPIKPRKKLVLILGAASGLVLGIIFAFLKYLINDKIESKEELEKNLEFPIIGTIPHINNIKNEIVVSKEAKSIVAESFRTVRTNLQFMVRDEKKIISVTSTISGEGKTFVSVNLATIISMTGQKTIILNLDMRTPTLHKKFKLKNLKGMSTFLSGKSLLYEIVQKTKYENLDVITSGPIPPNPSELVNNKAFGDLIGRLKEVYDVIIIDTPPIGLVSDARVVMDFSDVNIYIFRESYSKKKFIESANKLKEDGIKGLGVIYNDVSIQGGSYYGYGYYGN